MWTLLIFLWIVSGWVTLVWAITLTEDFKASDLLYTALIGALLGAAVPCCMFASYLIQKVWPTLGSIVIFKKRNSK